VTAETQLAMTEREAAQLLGDVLARTLANPLVLAQLAGLSGRAREERIITIANHWLRTDPTTRPRLDALRRVVADTKDKRMMAEAVLEGQVAAGRMRRATNPAGRTVYLPVEARS
jgi:hypothetical protein